MNITAGFNVFCKKLELVEEKQSLIKMRYNAIIKKLNTDFWGVATNYGGVFTGCYGRGTAIDGVKKIDLLFEMPSHLQSYYKKSRKFLLLEDVRHSICMVYPKTRINKEQNCVEVVFSDSTFFRLYPVFLKNKNNYFSLDHGNRKEFCVQNPINAINTFKQFNKNQHQVLSKLCKMSKSWKKHANVKIKDVLLDTLAYRFLLESNISYTSYSDFAYLCRDFFQYLMEQDVQKITWDSIDGSEIYNKENFRYKAILAHHKAVAAIRNEKDGRIWLATQKWKEIFGYKFPDKIVVLSQIKALLDRSEIMCSTQQLCATVLKKRVRAFRVFQVILALVILTGILMIEYTSNFGTGISLFTISFVVFMVNIYFKKYNISDISSRHIRSVSRIQEMQKELTTLQEHLCGGAVEVSIILEKKDRIHKRMTLLYRGTSKFISKKYLTTTQRLRMTSETKEKVPYVQPSKLKIPIWQSNSFFIENQVQCLMNTRKLMN